MKYVMLAVVYVMSTFVFCLVHPVFFSCLPFQSQIKMIK